MSSRSEKALVVLLVCFPVLLGGIALAPEWSISRIDLNDNVLHLSLVERIVQTVESGGNPLDCWSPEWSLGFPVLRDYQPVAHFLTAAAYFTLGKTVSLLSIFVALRFLSVVLLPVSFFFASRWFGLSRWTAAAAALLAPLISTDFLFGIEYGSYLWAGTGLFPQAVATHFLLLAVSLGYRAMRDGRRLLLAGVLVGLTVACHLIYGYIAALSLVLAALTPDAAPRPLRFRRLLGLGGIAFAVSAFQIVPLLQDSALINHSRWEPIWKWESYGASTVLFRLFQGELLDHGRLPVLSILAAAGLSLLWWNRRHGRVASPHVYLSLAAALWILMYFGRPFWGPLLTALGVLDDMHLHRVIGGAQIFLVLLAATALAALWSFLSTRLHFTAAIAVTAILLYPAVRERGQLLSNNAAWGRRNLQAHDRDRADLDAAIATAKSRPGRVYAGLAATWGGQFKVGDVPVYALLSKAHVPAVGFLYHSMALTGDLMVRFDDRRPDHYRLFGIGAVIAPAGGGPAAALAPIAPFGRFEVREAPRAGYFDLIDTAFAVKTNRRNFYDVNDRWLQSDWPAKRTHLLLDFDGAVSPDIARLDPEAQLPFIASTAPNAGGLSGERRHDETYSTDAVLSRAAYVLFKMTWHPRWRAYVDGAARPVAMVSPGFSAVLVDPGRHHVEFRYEPGAAKLLLAMGGMAIVFLLALRHRLGFVRLPGLAPAYAAWVARTAAAHRERLVRIGATLAICLPVCLPLFTSSVIYGHDAFCYFPRVVEIHQNLANGILLPRWAPDLGRGYGQPLFVFHPPLFYWISEIWRVLGWNPVAAVNLASATIVIAAGFAAFQLGRLYFGDRGGYLAAAAYLYAPYFAVDLYVRSSLEEFAAFPLFPLALYGFGAFARRGRRRYGAIGAVAFAALLYCHFPAALLFAPLLAAFCALTAWSARSWRTLAAHAAGLLLALAIGAAAWLPALAEKQYVAIERVLQGNGQYSTHFVYPSQLLSTFWGYGYSLRGREDGMSFALGWSHVAVALAAWIWLARRPKLADRAMLRFFAGAAIAFCILMLEDAIWFWDHLPLLPYVELPWRMLGPASLCLAMLAAAIAPAIATLRKGRALAFAAAMALLIVPNLSHLRPGRTAEVDLAFWTPRQLAVRGFETTTMGEMTPKWMPAVPPFNPIAAAVSTGDAQLRDIARTPFTWAGEVKAKTDSRIRLSLAWFPGWSVRMDGRTVDAGPAPGSGLIEFAAPAGDHTVDVAFGRSPARRLGEGISLVALIALGMLARRSKRPLPAAAPVAEVAHA